MIIKKYNGMNVEINKQFELISAFHAVLLLKHPELKDSLDFVETPNNEYMQELVNLINPDNYPKIIKYIMNFTDESVHVDIAVSMNDSYEIDNSKAKLDTISQNIKYGTAEDFSKEIKKLADDIKWDEFFENHRKTYEKFVDEVCIFPKELELNDIENYYSVKATSYTFIPSMLINGGFGPSDGKGNLYYFRGFRYDEKKKEFLYDNEYIMECLFHEFSHPIVNPLVDKYLCKSEELDSFYELSKRNNLHPAYSGHKETVMYEYLVRANAYILTSKYFEDIEPIENDWIIEHGFTFLPELVKFTKENKHKFKTYEEFVEKAIPIFMKTCIETSMKQEDNTNKRKRKQ